MILKLPPFQLLTKPQHKLLALACFLLLSLFLDGPQASSLQKKDRRYNWKKSHPIAFPVDEHSHSLLACMPHSNSPINSIIFSLSLSKFRHEPETTIAGVFSANFLFNLLLHTTYFIVFKVSNPYLHKQHHFPLTSKFELNCTFSLFPSQGHNFQSWVLYLRQLESYKVS